MIDEKRGLIGRKTLLSRGMICDSKSSKGTSNSRTPRTDIESTELFIYWDMGLAGSEPPASSSAVRFDIIWKLMIEGNGKQGTVICSALFPGALFPGVQQRTAPRKWVDLPHNLQSIRLTNLPRFTINIP